MKKNRTILLLLSCEAVLVAFTFLRAGTAEAGLENVARYTRVFSLMVFSPLFLLQGEKDRLKRWMSEHPHGVFATVHLVHVTVISILTAATDTYITPFLAALYIFTSLLTMFVVLSELRPGFIPGTAKFQKVSEVVFAYSLWALFFTYYYPKVEVSFGTSAFRENVTLLGWVSLLLGYRISRSMRYKRRR